MNKRRTLRAVVAALIIALSAGATQAAERTEIAAWRQDLAAMADLITEHHPAPFRNISHDEFEDAVATLDAALTDLDDKAIVVEMAKIVALIGDGHTRLGLPRQHPTLGLSLAHSADPPPARESLRFAGLPLRFGLFGDGLFVTAADPVCKELIGARVETVENMSVTQAIKAVAVVGYADNPQGHKLMATDRLTLPEVLFHLGLSRHPDRLTLGLVLASGKTTTRSIRTLPDSAVAALQIPSAAEEPLWLARRDERGFFVHLADREAVYVQLNEIAATDGQQFADFISEAVAEAQRQDAERLLLDLRHNHGGNGSWNAAIVDALARSRFNRYGSLFVMLGRGTFSAAQSLLGELEEYTSVIFVGEDSGSGPTHFGDPIKEQLPNSGLTLRVSTIEWHSWLAGDFREATSPHLEVAYRGSDYFSGRDPVLQAALDHSTPDGIAAQVEHLLRRGRTQSAAIRFLRYHTDTTIYPHNAAEEVVAAGHRMLDEGLVRQGFYMMALAFEFYPESAAARAGRERALAMRRK